VLTQKALTEGQRLLAYHTYLLEDVARLAGEEAERARAEQLVALLVPVVKSLLTDTAMETTSLAVQVHGGSGFIRETGTEQYLRDAKIACIYEGTNGIQALDLLGRKVLHTGGASVKLVAAEIGATIAQAGATFAPWAESLKALVGEWAELTRLVGERVQKDPDELGAAAVDYLNFAGYLLVGWCWLRMALVADAALKAASPEREFYEGKLAAARLYFERLLPRTRGFAAAVRAGAGTLPSLSPAHFGA